MTKKPAGTLVKMRETVHPRARCEPGDVLETSTGRRYQVVEVDGRGIVARVMRMGEPTLPGARVLTWTWNPRSKDPLPFTQGSTGAKR